jgi:hypothetical protein
VNATTDKKRNTAIGTLAPNARLGQEIFLLRSESGRKSIPKNARLVRGQNQENDRFITRMLIETPRQFIKLELAVSVLKKWVRPASKIVVCFRLW